VDLSQIFSKTKSRVILDEFMPRVHRIVQKQSVFQIGYAVLYATKEIFLIAEYAIFISKNLAEKVYLGFAKVFDKI
jgi:hypothetical protein